MASAQRHWRSNPELGRAEVAPRSVTGSQCQLPGAAVEGYCSLQCAPILLTSITLRLSQNRKGEAGPGFERSPGARALLCRFPTGLGRPLGAGALLPPGPSSRQGGWTRAAGQAAGRGAHPHHAPVSHCVRAPPPRQQTARCPATAAGRGRRAAREDPGSNLQQSGRGKGLRDSGPHPE